MAGMRYIMQFILIIVSNKAAYRGHYDVVKYFLDLESPHLKINCLDNQGNTPLMLACVRGYNQEIGDLNEKNHQKFAICKILLEKGANLKMYAQNGINNPLHWACYFGDIQTSKILVDSIPNLMLLQNDYHFFPIDHTLMLQKENQNVARDELVAEYLILYYLVYFLQSSTHKKKLQDLIMKIESSDYNEPVPEQMIIDQDNIQFKPNNNYKEEKLFLAMGHRYLYWAAVIGREDLVCSLMSFNLSPFTRSYKGRNAVHAATYQGNLNLLKIFFDNDISKRHVFQLGGITTAVNMMTEQQPETALHIAIQKGYQDVVSYLYALGADPEIHNYRNLTAFETTRDVRVKKIKQSILKLSKTYRRSIIRQGYKYILIGHENQNQKDDLLFQQLVNIQQKNVDKGRFKVLILKGFQNEYTVIQDNPNDAIPHDKNLVFYLLKVNDKLLNKVAEEEKIMLFNLREGIICRFISALKDQYENFHHRHTQQILLKLMNDEFDLEQFLTDGIVCEHFPLHDFEEKSTIYKFWRNERIHIFIEPFRLNKSSLRTLNALSSYYGAEVGFLIVFLTFFTSWLLIPTVPGALLGIYIYVKDDQNSPYVPIYIIFLAVWGTVFFEFWKRKQNEISYELDMHIAKEQKKKIPQYKGQFSVEEVTHEIVVLDKRSEFIKYMKSVIPLLALGVFMVTGQFILFDSLLLKYGHYSYSYYFSSVGYALSIIISNEIFYYFARLSLTIENHEFEDTKQNIYAIKVFSFTFMNSYIRLFYRSIISPDSKELYVLTACYSTVWALVHLIRKNSFQYNIFPMIFYNLFEKRLFRKKFKKYYRDHLVKKDEHTTDRRRKLYSLSSSLRENQDVNQSDSRNVELIEKSMPAKQQLKTLREIERTRTMVNYKDYIEQFTYLIIQFGNVTMFSSNFLFTPMIILILNWINIEATIYAHVKYIKRPLALPKKGIGLWNDILLVVGYIATVINCLTIYTANQEQLTNLIGQADSEETTQLRNFILLIAAEHIVLGIKFVIEQVIPDVPEWVETALKRQDYLEEKWHLQMNKPQFFNASPILQQENLSDFDKANSEEIKENSIFAKEKLD